jgi:flagellar basal-body rod protein FlgG
LKVAGATLIPTLEKRLEGMIRSLHTGVTGAEAQQNLIDTVSNNITNANTNAFKKSRVQFQDLLYQNIRAPGLVTTNDTIAPSGIQIGNGAHLASVEKIFQEGAIRITNMETDLYIRG